MATSGIVISVTTAGVTVIVICAAQKILNEEKKEKEAQLRLRMCPPAHGVARQPRPQHGDTVNVGQVSARSGIYSNTDAFSVCSVLQIQQAKQGNKNKRRKKSEA